ncbi:MAG: hypothetical protein FWD62_15465 [Betaproteobacteria bacterium]|nr:hypothetical protein [Betaproteobacteria bacterium]
MSELFEGVKLTLGRQTYIVPALTLKQLRQFGPQLAPMRNLDGHNPTEAEIDGVFEIIHAAISRNYPDVTVAQLQDVIDMNNLLVVMQVIWGQSGLERVKPGEA